MPRTNRLLIALSLALLLGLAGARGLKVATQFSRPSELTYPDSVIVRIVRDVVRGAPIYRDLNVAPHLYAAYGPLFYQVPAWIARATHADEVGIFEILRALSLVATLGSGAVIAVVLRRRGVQPGVIALAAGVYLVAADATWPGMLLERPDPAEVFFTLLGLGSVASGRRSARYVAPLLFLTAFLFKQSAVVGPLAAAIYLAAYAGRRAALTFAVSCVAVFATAIGGLQAATGGLYGMNDFGGLAGCNLSWTNPFSILGPVIAGNSVLWLAAAIGVGMAVRSRRLDPFVVFFVLHAVFATGTTLRDGSASNYYTATIAAAAVICGSVVAQLVRERSHAPAAVLLLAIALFCFGKLATELGQLPDLWQVYRTREPRHAEELRALRALAQKLDALGGPILSQADPVNLYAQNSIIADLLAFACFADRGLFDDAEIIRKIRAREFAAIVLRFPASATAVAPRYQSSAVFRDEWLTALREANYRESPVRDLYVYTPDRGPGWQVPAR